MPERRLAVRVTKDVLRQIRGGHPWVYDKAITSVSDEAAAPGTLAVIFDDKRRFAAIGLWDPISPIRVRILHAGKPTQIDDAFWASRVEDALATRSPLESTGTTGMRLIHGENDGFGGLVVDRYDRTLVLKLYASTWLPHLNQVVDSLVTAVAPERIVLRLGRNAARDSAVVAAGLTDGQALVGDVPSAPILFIENGLTFEADVIEGQKTGHFLDQRDNRQFVRSVAKGRRVLDVFSCTGGFSVYAAAGGATLVHSVDIAPAAIETAQRNFAHNSNVVAGAEHRRSVGDAFEVMTELGEAGERYDIVVIDPPSFASRARERDGAMRAYRKLSELALPLVAPGGRLLQASCSSRITEDDLHHVVHSALRSNGRTVSEEQWFGHALDHPISFPEGLYLKAMTGLLA